jgi:hypothetical protein
VEARTETRDGQQFVVRVLEEAKPDENRSKTSRFRYVDVDKPGTLEKTRGARSSLPSRLRAQR